MNREHEAAAAATSQLTEQLAVQQLAAKQALKQVRFPAYGLVICSLCVQSFDWSTINKQTWYCVPGSAARTMSAYNIHARQLLTS